MPLNRRPSAIGAGIGIKAIEEPDKGHLIGKAGYEGADTCEAPRKSSSVKLAARLSWSRENITAVIPRTPSHGKMGSLAYRLTRICVVP
jgi:hypothetical protein